jgi:hypothetical protein
MSLSASHAMEEGDEPSRILPYQGSADPGAPENSVVGQ